MKGQILPARLARSIGQQKRRKKEKLARQHKERSRLSPLWEDLFRHIAGAKFASYVSPDDQFNTDAQAAQSIKMVLDRMRDDLNSSAPVIELPCILASVHPSDFKLINKMVKTVFPKIRYKSVPWDMTGPHTDYPRAIFYTGKTPNSINIRLLMKQKGVTLL